jgi:hypothetical protein
MGENRLMAICGRCQTKQERPCTYTQTTREYFRVLIRPLRHVAECCGYAIGVHGSLKTDIDLIAVPWRDSAVSAAHLAEKLRATAEQIIGSARIRESDRVAFGVPEKKPCGRLGWSFYLSPHEDIPGPYIDLSVMPVTKSNGEVG